MLRLILVGLAMFALGVGAGALKWRASAEVFHREARMAAILSHAGQMPKGGVVVIGDSVAEQVRFDTLCGKPALNAGIAWSSVANWRGDARKVIEAARPSLVILSLGTNGADGFEELVRETGAAFAVAPAAKSLPAVVPLVAGPTSTRDGVHPTVEGARQWIEAVEEGC